MSRRATDARGSRAGEIPATTSVRSRSPKRAAYWSAVIAPIEKPRRERFEPELIRERGQIVDQPVVTETRGDIPLRPAVATGVRNVQPERLREQRDLWPEILPTEGRRPVEHDERRAGAVDVVTDVQAIRADRRHVPVNPRAETNR
jgi:hypothetical protein